MRATHGSLGTALYLGLIAAGCAAQGSDNKSFGPEFEIDGGVLSEGGTVATDTGVPPGKDASSTTDSGGDAATDAGTALDAGDAGTGCASGRVAILSGSPTTLFASLSTGGAAFLTSSMTGSVAGVPALIDAGGGVQAVVRDKDGALQGLRTTGAGWTTQGRIGTRVARDTPSLAATGAQIHLVYQDSVAFTYFHGVFGGTTWDAAADPVRGPAPAGQSYGANAAAIMGVGAELVLVNGGASEGPLYAQSFSGAAWTAGVAVSGTAVCGTATPACGGLPGIVKLAGTSDLLTLHIDKTTKSVTASVRKAVDKTWSTTGAIRPTAPIATTMEQISLAPAGTNRVVAAFRGTDQKAYAALGDLTATPITWSAPVAILATTVAAPPQVAVGACGDDAVAVVVSAGEAKVVRLKGTTWGSAEPVPGTTGAVYAAISSNGAL